MAVTETASDGELAGGGPASLLRTGRTARKNNVAEQMFGNVNAG